MEKKELSEDMPVCDIHQIVAYAGVSTWGNKREIIDRYNLAFDAKKRKLVVKPALNQLRSISQQFEIKGCRTKEQYIEMLEKNGIEWQYTEHSRKKELQNGIEHLPASALTISKKLWYRKCDECGTHFISPNGYSAHVKAGHVKPFNQLLIMKGEFTMDICKLELYNDVTHARQYIFQIVLIPWYDVEQIVNVSIGMTSWNNVLLYANGIWKSIKAGLARKSMYLTGCGSGRMVATRLNWKMKPEDARSIGVFGMDRIVGSKVKGFVRELIGAVHVFSASDECGYLTDCSKHIIEQVERNLGYMADVNESIFDYNTLHPNTNITDPKLKRVFLVDTENVLEEWDL